MNSSVAKRLVVLDTETTGMNQEHGPVYLGHRVIEIGCVELINRRLTGRHFHHYINPGQTVDPQAIKVHGITNQHLADKPKFAEVQQAFIDFIQGAELIIHNASFDCGFLDQELRHTQSGLEIARLCQVTDTLQTAREKFPGKRNSLDALCDRFGIDNSHRVHHGALLDAEILADVYLMLTGGQTSLDFASQVSVSPTRRSFSKEKGFIEVPQRSLKVLYATPQEREAHTKRLSNIAQVAPCRWFED